MRGDNIEEDHFTETTWATLLSYSLTLEETDGLKKSVSEVNVVNEHGHMCDLTFNDEML